MHLTRRELLAGCAGALAGGAAAAADQPRTRMGVVIHSYGIRARADRGRTDGINDPLAFLEHVHRLGGAGIQTSLGMRDKEYTAKLRSRAETLGLYVEGIIGLPKDAGDVDRFAGQTRAAKDAGATVFRSAILSGRRYETFNTAADFREFARQAWQSLTLAEPVAAKHEMRLAVENHKDWLVPELLDVLKRLDSRFVGVTLDTGNSIALLEEPMEVVEAYARWTFTTHFKDMGVREYEDGFLLSEVPLGTGFLDLKKIVKVLRAARPEVRFNLEMITRDPLKVPCLMPKYWATLEQVPGRQLAKALAMVRKTASKEALPRVSGLSAQEQIKIEEENVRQSLTFATNTLAI